MLTRLKVTGFKNLVDVDVRFGPFTCIAGANGVGKSNLFDAIQFLSALADRPLIEAALSVRDEGGKTADVRNLFHRVGDTYSDEMSFEVEMIVPKIGVDDLGQEAEASITFLRYSLVIGFRQDERLRSLGGLQILKEALVHITLGEAYHHLLFPHGLSWRKSVVRGARRTPAFISTEGYGQDAVIKLHQDGGSSGRPRSLPAVNLLRTVLSATNAAESPTALLARREMQSWKLLQLEPSSLRRPDEFTAPTSLGSDGSHLASTLYHLISYEGQPSSNGQQKNKAITSGIQSHVANRLYELINDVRYVNVDRDDKRELLTLTVTGRDGTSHPARALSDGTLRFLALAILELDPQARGVICLEEPENGINPPRIPAMLTLLQDIATDVNEPVDADNPLRQVIINTHSPSVVAQVPDDCLLVADLQETIKDGRRFNKASFSYLEKTWRHLRLQEGEELKLISKGDLLAYLNPVPQVPLDGNGSVEPSTTQKRRRVVDREDLQILLPFTDEPEELSSKK